MKKLSLVGGLVGIIVLSLLRVPMTAYGQDGYIRDPNNPILLNVGGEVEILKEGDTYHLFYSGHPTTSDYDTMHATSDSIDGVFIPDPANPVFDVVGGHGGLSILMNPATHQPVMRSLADLGLGDDTTQLYWLFHAYSIHKIQVATNTSLYGEWTWFSPVLVASADGWDSYKMGHNGIVVIAEGDAFKMLYMADNRSGQYMMGLATSSNLIDWDKSPLNPIIESTPWSWRIKVNDLWKDEAGYILVYTGDVDGVESLGKAYSTDLINWTMEETPSLSPVGLERSTSDFAIFREGGKEYVFYESGGKPERIIGVSRAWRLIDEPPAEPFIPAVQWSYLVREFTDISTLEVELNTLGAQGWELIGIVQGDIFIFKRED